MTVATDAVDSVEEEEEVFDEDISKEKVDRAAAYRDLIQKDEQANKQFKKAKKSSLVEVEAEEEEEDQQGLGDFGFKISSSTLKEGESERVVANEDDFENIVDDLSDNEGDDDAGDLKRRAQLAKEDQDAKEEIKRRMREGFSGRGLGALRGRNNASALFSLSKEQKKDGLKINLDVVDEFDEKDDKDNNLKENDELIDDEEKLIVDENVEIDMMIKERYGVTQQVEESDSDSEEEVMISDDKKDNAEEEDELTDLRVAKQWEKRVKMRRVLANQDTSNTTPYFGLLEEEDTDSQSMMSMLKRSANPLKRTNSAQFNQDSNFGDIGLMRSASIPGADTLGSRKGSFIAMKRTTSLTANKTVSNNRFVFQGACSMGGEDSQSSVSNAWTDHVSRSMTAEKSSMAAPSEKSSEAKRPMSLSSALWTSIAANKFKKHKK